MEFETASLRTESRTAASKSAFWLGCSWQSYIKQCGKKAYWSSVGLAPTNPEFRKIFREKYRGGIVYWTGKISKIQQAVTYRKSSQKIIVAMTPPDRKEGDIRLSVSSDAITTKFESGSTISFLGCLQKQGGKLTPHHMHCINYTIVENEDSNEAKMNARIALCMFDFIGPEWDYFSKLERTEMERYVGTFVMWQGLVAQTVAGDHETLVKLSMVPKLCEISSFATTSTLLNHDVLLTVSNEKMIDLVDGDSIHFLATVQSVTNQEYGSLELTLETFWDFEQTYEQAAKIGQKSRHRLRFKDYYADKARYDLYASKYLGRHIKAKGRVVGKIPPNIIEIAPFNSEREELLDMTLRCLLPENKRDISLFSINDKVTCSGVLRPVQGYVIEGVHVKDINRVSTFSSVTMLYTDSEYGLRGRESLFKSLSAEVPMQTPSSPESQNKRPRRRRSLSKPPRTKDEVTSSKNKKQRTSFGGIRRFGKGVQQQHPFLSVFVFLVLFLTIYWYSPTPLYRLVGLLAICNVWWISALWKGFLEIPILIFKFLSPKASTNVLTQASKKASNVVHTVWSYLRSSWKLALTIFFVANVAIIAYVIAASLGSVPL